MPTARQCRRRLRRAERLRRLVARRRRLLLEAGAEIEFVQTDGNAQLTETSTAAFSALCDNTDFATYSFWINIPANVSGTGTIFTFESGFQDRSLVRLDSSERLVFTFNTSFGTSYIAATEVVDKETPLHVMVAINTDDDTAEVWVNGTRIVNNTGLGTGFAMDDSQSGFNVGSDRGSNQHLQAAVPIGDLWVGQEYVASPVGTFIEAAGTNPTPRDSGGDGSGYTGTQPLIYFKTLADFQNGDSRGTYSGGFTLASGAFSAA
jgi:hypothetical protein